MLWIVGIDNNLFYKNFTRKNDECNFVIRAEKTRNLIYKGNTMNILDVTKFYKGKYAAYFKDKYGNIKKAKYRVMQR
jgi:hypothetical protein